MRVNYQLAMSLGLVACLAALVAAQDAQPLADAVSRGDIAAVRTLLGQKADVNAALADGSTALHLAARKGHPEIARMLIAAGARPEVVNRYNATPLAEAAAHPSGPIASMLLRAGANPNTVTIAGETALMTAAYVGNVDAATALVDAGADINAKESSRDQTALMWAAGRGHAAVVKLLAARGADLAARDKVVQPAAGGRGGGGGGGGGGRGGAAPAPTGGMTALLYAARQGDKESVKALLDAGANINEVNAAGWTALLLAISNTYYDTAALILERGADLNITDSAGRSALYAAVDMHTIEPASANPIRQELDTLTSVQLAQALMARGANPNLKLVQGGTTAFLRAATKTDLPMMKLLLAGGADPSVTLDTGSNAIMLVTASGGVADGQGPAPRIIPRQDLFEAIAMCLERGLDINAVNSAGETALHVAARNGTDALVTYLVEKGARIDVRNMRGFTPLDLAEGKGAMPGRNGGTVTPTVRESTAALLRQLASKAP